MGIFNFDEMTVFGKVQSVDTSNITICVGDSDLLSKLQVNNLVVIRSPKAGQSLIGIVNKIMRKFGDENDLAEGEEIASFDLVKVTLIGTLINRLGTENNVFKRTLESVAEIDADCYIMTETILTNFMSVITKNSEDEVYPLKIGSYAISESANAWLDGNKLFQRHAVITGSTGSGKSYTVATLVEQIAKLPSANAVVFDIHGEYKTLEGDNIAHYKIAGPSDELGEDVLFLPCWLLTYDEMLSMIIDRSDNNAPNQAMLFNRYVTACKREYLYSIGKTELAETITVDSPIPFRMNNLLGKLEERNCEMVDGAKAGSKKQGEFYGKLTRFIQRLKAKTDDKRLNFLFSKTDDLVNYNYLNDLCGKLLKPACQGGGIKIIDFSEVPSDILPLIVSLVARLIFTVQQWTDRDKTFPIALFCDEAHLYLPQNVQKSSEQSSVDNFERIAKEGRKYGVGLVVVTQRPSEVSRTILSQSGNFIAMRLTNSEDQGIIKKLLPDNLGSFSELLPILDVGEALIVGDASLLPSRIKISEPTNKPQSDTVKFWDEWSRDNADNTIDSAVESLRKQSKT
ncbi:MAG: DUF853 family protein [Eubacterium sp.]|nr:DUF853 family protein [Eubacterium sp.]